MLSEMVMAYYLLFVPSNGFTHMELWEVGNKRWCYVILSLLFFLSVSHLLRVFFGREDGFFDCLFPLLLLLIWGFIVGFFWVGLFVCFLKFSFIFYFILKKCVYQSLEHFICAVISKADDIKLSFPKSLKYIPRQHLVRIETSSR